MNTNLILDDVVLQAENCFASLPGVEQLLLQHLLRFNQDSESAKMLFKGYKIIRYVGSRVIR